MSNLFEHCRTGVSSTQSKIRKIERRSKRQLDYAETEYLRRSQSTNKREQCQILFEHCRAGVSTAHHGMTALCAAMPKPPRAEVCRKGVLRRLRPANTPAVDPRVGIPAEFLLRMTIANRHPGPNVAKRGRQPLFFPAIEPKTATTQTRRKIWHAMCRMKPERTSGG